MDGLFRWWTPTWPPVKCDAIISEDGYRTQGLASWSLWSRGADSPRPEIIDIVPRVFRKERVENFGLEGFMGSLWISEDVQNVWENTGEYSRKKRNRVGLYIVFIRTNILLTAG